MEGTTVSQSEFMAKKGDRYKNVRKSSGKGSQITLKV